MASSAFTSSQLSDVYPQGMERYWWNLARNNIIRGSLARLTPAPKCILEVGCGTGIVTDFLRKSNYDATGVDLSCPRLGCGNAPHLHYGIDAQSLPESTRRRVDTLAFFDVIEHIPDAVAFITNLISAFVNVKYIIVTVPARSELWTNFDDHYGHCRRYSLKQLDRDMEYARLTKISSRYYFHLLYAIIFATKACRKPRTIVYRPPKTKLKLFLNRFVAHMFLWERYLCPGRLVGSSIIGIYSTAKD